MNADELTPEVLDRLAPGHDDRRPVTEQLRHKALAMFFRDWPNARDLVARDYVREKIDFAYGAREVWELLSMFDLSRRREVAAALAAVQ